MPTGTARLLYIAGLVLMLLCIVDVLLIRFARIDLTGVSWTPIALGSTGILLMQAARFLGMSARRESGE
jgi:hypothetical protein